MPATFRCRVITPEARILDEECAAAVAPMHDGQMGFLPNRAAIVGKMGVGELRVTLARGETRSYLVDDGFLQMVNNRLTVLAALALPTDAINARDAQAELAEASARVPNPGDRLDAERVRKAQNRARAKVALAKSRG